MLALLMIFQLSMAYAKDIDTRVDKISTEIRRGRPAPFEGVLLTQRLSAEILENCNPGVTETRCTVRTQTEVELCKSACTKQIDILNTSILACQVKSNEIFAAKNKEIDFLHIKIDELTPRWYASPKLWFTVGIFAGAGIVIAVSKSVN